VTTPFDKLLNAATKEQLINLVHDLALDELSVQRKCLDYLHERVETSASVHDEVETSSILLLWQEIDGDLSELDAYGGGYYDVVENVADGLYQLESMLKKSDLSEEDWDELCGEILNYIKSGNAGMDDALYDVVYAMCKTDNQWLELAGQFEALQDDWPRDHAMRIYRKLGQRDKYLELRALKMRFGLDYYDLADFYWESGEKDKAMEVALRGMKNGEGRMDELRSFVMKRAKESGERAAWLAYYFAQQTCSFTLSSYQEFEQECSREEWELYEPKLVAQMEKNLNIEVVKIHLHRGEDATALRFFKTPCHPQRYDFNSKIFTVARELEVRYPLEMLAFYQSSTGNLNVTATRKEYAAKAERVAHVRRVFVDVLNRPDEWKAYAVPIKLNNCKRSAFQQEFARMIPAWDNI